MNPSHTLTPVGQATANPHAHHPHATTVIRRKLRPGEPGTRKLWAEYGEKLVCVRYRYNTENKRRLKTVELVVEEGTWEPVVGKISPSQIMGIWLPYDDVELQKEVKAAGGQWNPQRQTWELTYGKIRELKITAFILHRG